LYGWYAADLLFGLAGTACDVIEMHWIELVTVAINAGVWWSIARGSKATRADPIEFFLEAVYPAPW
jgi:hypothetical protein